MLTPQEVQERTFDKAVFGGYDMGEVDDFLDLLTEDYTSIYKENSLLKSKMKVLVQAVEKYRAKEEEIDSALKTAQENADNIISRANVRAAGIMGGAKEASESTAAAARQAAEAYIIKAKKLLSDQSEALARLEGGMRGGGSAAPKQAPVRIVEEEVDEPTIKLERPGLDATAEEIDRSVRQAVENDERASGSRKKPKFDFIDLENEKDYEL